jgi:hypothetical protein
MIEFMTSDYDARRVRRSSASQAALRRAQERMVAGAGALERQLHAFTAELGETGQQLEVELRDEHCGREPERRSAGERRSPPTRRRPGRRSAAPATRIAAVVPAAMRRPVRRVRARRSRR